MLMKSVVKILQQMSQIESKILVFEYAMRSGSTLAVADISMPIEKGSNSRKGAEQMLKASSVLSDVVY